MKAEHRKELQTNYLADRLGRFVQNLKSGNNTTSVIVWVFLLLALGLVAAWRWFNATSVDERSHLWTRLDAAETVPDFEGVVGERGTVAATYGRFQIARTRLNSGLENLHDSGRRAQAIEDIVKAKEEYDVLVQICPEPALLHQEALMGVAKAEEALLGVAKTDEAGASRGDPDKVLEYYRRLAQAKPDTFLVEAAKKRVEVLENPEQKKEFLEIYARQRDGARLPPRLPDMRNPHEGLFPP